MRNHRKGQALIEFTLVAIPLMFVQFSIVEVCRGMWDYHSLAQAVKAAARQVATRGAGCAASGCSMTVSQIAGAISGFAIGMPSSALNVTLTSSAGNVTCNPLSSCSNNSSVWPPGGREHRRIGYHCLGLVQFHHHPVAVGSRQYRCFAFHCDVQRRIAANASVLICGKRRMRGAGKRL